MRVYEVTSSSRLTAAQKAELDALKGRPIDTSDSPEVRTLNKGEWKRGLFYRGFRPVKKQLTLRIDEDVVDWFKNHAPKGSGYQTSINAALRKHVETHSGSKRA